MISIIRTRRRSGAVLAIMAFAGAPETQAWHVPAGIVGAALGVVIVRGTGRDG